MTHRGLLHHQIIVVSDLARASEFYGAMFEYLGYERTAKTGRYEDWKRWELDTPHEFSVVEVKEEHSAVPHVRGAVGHHHHIAFAAADRADVDRFYREVLAPLGAKGVCRVLDSPAECPEYGQGYYATFFEDPDGLRFEFVFNDGYFNAKAERGSDQQ
jgi:catechol 2,3-dioxygenase-like lactoylglutathione lyase family enzyme